MNKIIIFCITIFFFGLVKSQSNNNIVFENKATTVNAPLTIAGSVSACKNSSFNVPITFNNFSQVAAITLRLDYDPTKLNYNSYSNPSTLFPGGILIFSVSVSPTLKRINIVWTDVNAISVANGTKLVDLNFTLLSGSPTISFNNISNNSGDCEFADALGNVLNDTPTSSYFTNSLITNLSVDNPQNISGLTSVCIGQNNITYTVPAITNATTYIWTLPTGVTGTSNTNSITVNYGINAVSGNITVKGSNVSCGFGTATSLSITVNPKPASAGNISGLTSICQGQQNVIYSVPPINNASNYIWTLPTGATGTSDSNSILVNYSNTSVTGDITVKGNNNCGAGEPAAFYIIVNPLPTANAGNDITVCKGDTVILSATGGVSYQWNNNISQNNPFFPVVSSDYIVQVTDNNNCSAIDTVFVAVKEKYIEIKVFLEGLYTNNNQMTEALDEYGNPVWGNTIADKITIELRENNSPYNLVETIFENLSTNGILNSKINCNNISNYYIVIKHRNHLETWSSTPISFSGDTITYNFSNSISTAYGDNLKEVAIGSYVILVGDVNQDGVVDLSDLVEMDTDLTNGSIGYIVYDLNGDGVVDLSDLVTIDENLTNGSVAITP
jgi:hypothetical protein